MMRGTVTLDFIFALVLLIATTTPFFFLAYTQLETTEIASAQMQAEAMAMSAGSAVNHFAAIGPEDGSELVVVLTQPEDPGFAVDLEECFVSVDTTQGLLTVYLTAYRMESSSPDYIEASYPLVELADLEGSFCWVDDFGNSHCGGTLVENCSSGFGVYYNEGTLEVDPL